MTESKQPIGYLIGSICHAKNREHAFDASERAVLEAGHLPLNPVKEEPTKTGMTCTQTEEKLRTLWHNGQLVEHRKIMDKIWQKDLDNVRRADYLVLHFEQEDTSIGAPVEMTFASIAYLLDLLKEVITPNESAWLEVARSALKRIGFFHKPIYWVCQGAHTDANSTLQYLVGTESPIKVFKTYKELTEHLIQEYGKYKVGDKK
jgi:hypothetical protein